MFLIRKKSHTKNIYMHARTHARTHTHTEQCVCLDALFKKCVGVKSHVENIKVKLAVGKFKVQ